MRIPRARQIVARTFGGTLRETRANGREECEMKAEQEDGEEEEEERNERIRLQAKVKRGEKHASATLPVHTPGTSWPARRPFYHWAHNQNVQLLTNYDREIGESSGNTETRTRRAGSSEICGRIANIIDRLPRTIRRKIRLDLIIGRSLMLKLLSNLIADRHKNK